MGVGLAPSARQAATYTGISGTRSLRPARSAGVRTARFLVVSWRAPRFTMPSTRTPFLARKSWCIAWPIGPASTLRRCCWLRNT